MTGFVIYDFYQGFYSTVKTLLLHMFNRKSELISLIKNKDLELI